METNKIVQAFETELNLTEQGFIELAKEKKGLVIDVSTDSGFKEARKERTELNKVLKSVDRLAIDGKTDIDTARNTLKDRLSGIYAPIVQQFEKEDARRKEIARQKEEAEKQRIAEIHERINGLKNFSSNLFGKSSEELQEIIEAVDLIDVSENFAELTQEAMTVKKEVLIELNGALSTAIQNEQLAVERKKLEDERKQQEEANRLNALKAKAQERLNNLMMIPTTMFGKSSGEIDIKIASITNFEIKEEEFGEFYDQAHIAVGNVVGQLKIMLDQQLLVEKTQAEERAKVEAEKQAEAERIAQIKANDAELQKREQSEEKPVEQRLAERFAEPEQEEKTLEGKLIDWSIEHDLSRECFSKLVDILESKSVNLNL